jgi:hypothetical protein
MQAVFKASMPRLAPRVPAAISDFTSMIFTKSIYGSISSEKYLTY